MNGKANFGKYEYHKHPTNVMFKITLNPRYSDEKNGVLNPSSLFNRKLKSLDKNKHYIVFQVFPDSYYTYLLSRRIAEQKGFNIGWNPEGKRDFDYHRWTGLKVYGAKAIEEKRKADAAGKPPPPKKPPAKVLD